ncbi:hypothetical protein MTO96_017599 [Rhipicephalus appendiculatus]
MYNYPVPPAQAMGTPAYGQENFNEISAPLNYPSSFSSGSKAYAISDRLRIAAVVACTTVFIGIIIMAVVMVPLLGESDTMDDEIAERKEPPAVSERDLGAAREVTAIIPEDFFPNLLLQTYADDMWVGLLCTIGTNLYAQEMLPKDGVCDYLIYDSVYKDGPTSVYRLINKYYSLSIFFDGGMQMTKTILGIAFAYKYRQVIKSQLTTAAGTVPPLAKYFFDRDICNFGIVDTPTNSVDKYSGGRNVGNLEDTIYVEAFSKIFTPNIVVILSHYAEGDSTFEDCRVVPPTMLQRPASMSTNSSYKHDMNKAAHTLRMLDIRGLVASWALSVTMKGRFTVLKPRQPLDFLSECEHDPQQRSFGSYTEICNDGAFREDVHYKTKVRGTIFHSTVQNLLFSFDTGTTLVEKLCSIRVLQVTFPIGVVAFDIDYDDFGNITPYKYVECHVVRDYW